MQPTPEEVRSQLERLLASETLAGSARLRRFLTFIVERALEGEGRQLKEYSVGIEVFDRGDQYDPRIDSIVRVEAGRLRSRLDDYYRDAGRDDVVIVRIPRGGYTPVFERRPAPVVVPSANGSSAAPSAAGRRSVRWLALALVAASTVLVVMLAQLPRTESAGVKPAAGPRAAVLPFMHYSTDPAVGMLAARITDGVMTELVRAGHLQVVSRTSTQQFSSGRGSLKEVAKALNADVVVEGSVLVDGDRVRVKARMVDPERDRKLSLHEFEGTLKNLDDLQRQIADAIDVSTRRAVPR